MAATSFAFADPRAQTKWSKDVFRYALQNVIFTPLMGKTKSSMIRVNMELTTQPGGTIVFESRNPLQGGGQGDDGTTTGNEEALKRRNMSVEVHERAHSVVSAGKMSEQLTRTKIREDAKNDLGEWFSEALENDIVTSAAGLYNENSSSSSIQTINESYPTSNRIYYGGQTKNGTMSNSDATYATDALLTAGTTAYNLMGTKLLEKVRRLAIKSTPRMMGITIYDVSKATPNDIRNGVSGPTMGKHFLVLLSPLQCKSIKAELGTTGWATATSHAQRRGNQNPIFSGNAFMWDGMVCWEYDRIPSRTGAGGTTLAEGFLLDAGRTATTDAVASGDTVDRALLMGANALSFAWAQKLEWSEDFVDNNKPKVKVDALYGIKRTNFNAHGTSDPTSAEAIFCIDTEVNAD